MFHPAVIWSWSDVGFNFENKPLKQGTFFCCWKNSNNNVYLLDERLPKNNLEVDAITCQLSNIFNDKVAVLNHTICLGRDSCNSTSGGARNSGVAIGEGSQGMRRRNSAAANKKGGMIHGSRESSQWQDRLGAPHSRYGIKKTRQRLQGVIGSISRCS